MNLLNVQQETAALIALLRIAMFQNETNFDFTNTNLEKVYTIASSHSIANIIAIGVEKAKLSMVPALKEKFEVARQKAIYAYVLQTMELEAISKELEKSHINFMPLKGSFLKYLYPSPDMRTCGDIDILLDCDPRKVYPIMDKLGYTFQHKHEKDVTHDFFKAPVSFVELHEQLFINQRKYSKYFKEPFQMAHRIEGKQYEYEFSLEDTYAYLFAHMAKHFSSGGSGVRPIIDLYLYRNAYKDKLDYPKIQELMARLKLTVFEEKINHLMQVWFEGANADQFDADLTEYIINSGTFGTVNQYVAVRMMENQNLRHSKFKKEFQLIFPPYSAMKVKYPTLSRAPVLLPFFWFIRMFKIFTPQRKGFEKTYKTYSDVSANDLEYLSKMHNELQIDRK